MTTKERILQFLKNEGVSVSDFCDQVNLSISNFKGIARSSELGSDKIAKILTLYPDLSPDWLLLEKGNMIRGEKKETIPVAKKTESCTEGIPLIPINAMAGVFTGDQTILEYECERYVVPIFKGADFLIAVKGSSMMPKYNSGDIVACKKLSMSDYFFQWNKVYVLDTDQGPLIKRIKPGSDKDHILIVSENSDYNPFELGLDHIHNLALVIGVIRME